MIRTRKEYPEFGTGRYWILESTHPEKVFAHACEDESGSAVAALHNFSSEPVTVSFELWDKRFDHFVYLFEERGTELIKDAKISLELAGYGFSWLRLKTKYG